MQGGNPIENPIFRLGGISAGRRRTGDKTKHRSRGGRFGQTQLAVLAFNTKQKTGTFAVPSVHAAEFNEVSGDQFDRLRCSNC